MKLRSLAIGLSLLTAGTVIGVSTQQFAAAKISSGDRPVLVPIEPCRLADTRPGNATIGPRSSPIGAADTLTVDAQEPGTKCTGKIPTDALSLALNVTAVGASERTFLTIWAGGARPDASSLNPAPGAPPTPNAVTVDLSVDQEFEIYNNLGALNIIVDVTGYYENHDHDDRYPLATDVSEALAETKFLSINIYADPGLGFDDPTNQTDWGNRGGDIDFNLTLPPDYTAGTPIKMRLLMYPTVSPCKIDLLYNGSLVSRPGRPTFSVQPVEHNFVRMLEGARVPTEFVFEFPGTDLLPLDSFSVGYLYGGPGVCVSVFSGASLTYQ